MDVKLHCEAVKCIFNVNELCSAREIEVQGDDTLGSRFTYCGTFDLESDDDSHTTLKNYSVDHNYNNFTNSPEVKCSAINCYYNGNHHCQAPYLEIQSHVSTAPIQTECYTFTPKLL